jgi:hypothetical protein
MSKFLNWVMFEMDVLKALLYFLTTIGTVIVVAMFAAMIIVLINAPTKEEFYAQCERGETATWGTDRAAACTAHLLATGRK